MQNVVADPRIETLVEVLDLARATPFLFTWHPDDVQLVDLYEEAAEMEEEWKTAPKDSPEDVALRNKLRKELKAALENDADRLRKQKLKC